jgi:hypothetical protein
MSASVSFDKEIQIKKIPKPSGSVFLSNFRMDRVKIKLVNCLFHWETLKKGQKLSLLRVTWLHKK